MGDPRDDGAVAEAKGIEMKHALAAVMALAAPLYAQESPPAAAGSQATYRPVRLTAAQARADVDLLQRALETIHPGLYRYRSKAEMDAAFGRLRKAASTDTTDMALWRAVAELVAEIRCDHSKAESSAAIDQWRDGHATMLPLRFQLIEGRAIVVSSDGQPGSPPRGAELLSINGMPIPLVLADLARAVSYDGTTDQSVAAKLTDDSDLTGDDLNEFWPAYFGFPSTWQIGWRGVEAAKSQVAILAPIDFKRWTGLAWPGAAYRDEFYKAIGFRVAGKAAYLRIDTFVNYRNPVDATSLLDGFFKTLKARKTEHLILDLRANGGGSVDVSVALARYILPGPFLWSKPVRYKAIRYGDLPDHLESWGDRKAMFEPPVADFQRTSDGWWDRIPRTDNPDDESAIVQQVSADRYSGRLTILGGPRNGSGATRTIAQFHEAGARLVGQDTGGSAEGPTSGSVFVLKLPNSGLRVRIANAWNRSTVRNFVKGKGVAADEVVVPTLADFSAGRDRALDVAKAAAVPAPPAVGELLQGGWTGSMDYRDFGNDRRVRLPVSIVARGTGPAVTLDETFDDGPGKTVLQKATFAEPTRGVIAIDGDRFRVIERRASADRRNLTIVAVGSGIENGSKVDVQISIVRDGDQLDITRATRRSNTPFVLRHGYRLMATGAGA